LVLTKILVEIFLLAIFSLSIDRAISRSFNQSFNHSIIQSFNHSIILQMTEPAAPSDPLDPLNLNPVDRSPPIEPVVRFNPYAPEKPSADDPIDYARCTECCRWTLVPPLPVPLPPCLPYLQCSHCPFKILSTSYYRWLASNPEVKHTYHPIKSKRPVRLPKGAVNRPHYRQVGAEIPGGNQFTRIPRPREPSDPYRDIAKPKSKRKRKRKRTKHDDASHVADVYRRLLSQSQ
jgi:hypothetical protein